jgi:hypothetical protein
LHTVGVAARGGLEHEPQRKLLPKRPDKEARTKGGNEEEDNRGSRVGGGIEIVL